MSDRKRKQGVVTCNNTECGVEFNKDLSEIKRNERLGRKNYCSLTCSGRMNNKHLHKYGSTPENITQLKRICGNSRDKFTEFGFREHLRRAKRRKYECDLTLEYLYDLWVSQNGECVYSGVKLCHPNSKSKDYVKASLDRIDSSMGYVVGNVQFVSMSCNLAKCGMSHKDMLYFCDIMKG